MTKRENGTLVRTNLTLAEYREIRTQAIQKGKTTKEYAGDHLRKLLPKEAR